MVRRLVAEGVPRRQVARELGISRATVDRALASEGPPKVRTPGGGDVVLAVRGQGENDPDGVSGDAGDGDR